QLGAARPAPGAGHRDLRVHPGPGRAAGAGPRARRHRREAWRDPARSRRPVPAAPSRGALGGAGHAHRRPGALERRADGRADPRGGLGGRGPHGGARMSAEGPTGADGQAGADAAMSADVAADAHLLVTDAHLHLWDLGASPYAWLAGAPAPLRRTVSIEDVRDELRALGVTRVILVQ